MQWPILDGAISPPHFRVSCGALEIEHVALGQS